MSKRPSTQNTAFRRKRGFERASGLLASRIKTVSEKRGFAVTRLLTHWADIVGPDMAAASRPVEIKYGRGGFGATLTVLTTGSNAPLLQMQEPRLREKVNACYGYTAISRIRITQTASTGFAEGQASFAPAPKPSKPAPSPAARQEARSIAQDVGDSGLRSALETLATNVLSKTKHTS